MQKYVLGLILLFNCLVYRVDAQKSNIEDLYFYADVMVHADAETHRLKALEEFKRLFEIQLNKANSFSIPLEKTPYISTIIPPDSSFKLFTFQMNESSGKTIDFGYIQIKENGSFHKLNPTSDFEDIEYEELSADRWVSSLYYHLVPFVNEGRNHYLLFGFSQPSSYQKRKVIEVLTIEDGKPIFGAPVLVTRQENTRNIEKHRKIFIYSADVSMTIRDDRELNAIVIDHLMEVRSRIPGISENTFVPDGTYTAYFKDDNVWVYKDKLWGAGDVREFQKDPSAEKSQSGLFKNRKN